MIKPINFVLSKGNLESSQQYSQRVIKMQNEEIQMSRAVSTKTINMKKKEEQYVVKQPTKEQKNAAVFLRNILRQILRKSFRLMLTRLVIKKTAYKLLTSKRKRDIEAAFLAIKNYKIKSQHAHLQKFFQKHTQLRILNATFKKKENQNVEFGFNCIKNLSIRTSKVNLFLIALDESTTRCIKRCYYSHFFNKLRQIDVLHYQRSLKALDIFKIDCLRIHNLQQQGFNKIVDSILIGQCENTSEIKKNKHEEFNSMNASKKQQLTQIREQLKALKGNIDLQKQNKNRVFQQRKKVGNTNKAAMIEATRKFQKQFKEEEAITKDIEDIYNIRERVINAKNRLKQNSFGSQELCLNLITIMGQHGDRIKNLSQILPQIDIELSKFKESQVYLLKTNALLQKLIEIYEKRQPYNYQSEYYELEYENNVIKEMIRCFIKQQEYAAIHTCKKDQNQNEMQ